MKARLSYHRWVAMLALAAVIALISTGALVPSAARGSVSPLTSPAKIRKLAAAAYVWGSPAEFVYRFLKYNTLVTAPLNALGGGSVPAAWNNNATNGGDASVLYLNAMIDLSGQKGRGGTKELVLTVPPSKRNYYVVNLLDDFINTVGSIGTRTTPSARAQTYLLAGPTSRYAHKRVVRIHGFTYRVLPYDTNLGWILIRIRADSLVPAERPCLHCVDPQERRRALRDDLPRQVRGKRTSAEVLHTRPVRTNQRPDDARCEMAHRPEEGGRLLRANGCVAQTQPAPDRDHWAQRHPAADPAELDRSAEPSHPTLPQPVVSATAHIGSVQAPRPGRDWLQDPEQLGPQADRGPPVGLPGRAEEDQRPAGDGDR